MSEPYKCCNKADLRDAYIVIWGIKFHAKMCFECGEVIDWPMNFVEHLFVRILYPFWNGAVMVDEDCYESEKYR